MCIWKGYPYQISRKCENTSTLTYITIKWLCKLIPSINIEGERKTNNGNQYKTEDNLKAFRFNKQLQKRKKRKFNFTEKKIEIWDVGCIKVYTVEEKWIPTWFGSCLWLVNFTLNIFCSSDENLNSSLISKSRGRGRTKIQNIKI